MPEPEDLVIGKIAVQMGLISPGQLDRMKELSRVATLPLETVLTERGAISEADLQRILELRKLSVDGELPEQPKRREACLAARQYARERLMTQEVADECLRDLVIEGEKRSFDDLVVERHLVTREKVNELKTLREKRSMHCPRCKLNFTVRSATGRKVVDCPKCKQPLEEIQGRAKAPRADSVEFQTTVIRKIDLSQPIPPPSGAPAPKISLQCIICDKLFDSVLDENDRVKCPHCGSSFRPRS